MSNTLQVRVTSRKSATENWFEGTVSIAGLKPTKLSRKSDGSTQFSSRSALSGAARNVAKSLGYSDVDFGEQAAAKTAKPIAVAAKKSSKKSASKKARPSRTAKAVKPTPTV